MDGVSIAVGGLIGLAVGFAAGFFLFRGKPETAVGPEKPNAEALRLIALMQRDGRFLDFVMEDISGYADAQVGAAVRDIHKKCREVLEKHLRIAPVMPDREESEVTVPPGFDPSAIRLTGSVTGQPPFRGVLKHAGWRVEEIRLPAPPQGQDEFVLQSAEVELP